MKWWTTPLGLTFLPGALADVSLAEAGAIVSAPIFLLKNLINLVQLWKASKILVGVDLAERAKAKAKRS